MLELAYLPQLSFLQAVYGAVSLALLVFAALAPVRSHLAVAPSSEDVTE